MLFNGLKFQYSFKIKFSNYFFLLGSSKNYATLNLSNKQNKKDHKYSAAEPLTKAIIKTDL